MTGGWRPEEFRQGLRDSGLPQVSRFLAGVLVDHADLIYGYAWPSQAQLAYWTRLSPEVVNTYLARLVHDGWLVEVESFGPDSVYRLVIPSRVRSRRGAVR